MADQKTPDTAPEALSADDLDEVQGGNNFEEVKVTYLTGRDPNQGDGYLRYELTNAKGAKRGPDGKRIVASAGDHSI